MIKDAAISTVELGCRLFIGIVFIYAGVPKILDPYNFGLSIATYQMMPLWVINIMAIVMPWLEVFCAVMIIAGFRTRSNAFIITMLNIMFLIAIFQALQRELMLSSCGCFASEQASEEVTWSTFWRDIGFLAASVTILILCGKAKLSIDYLLKRKKEAHT